MIVWLITIGEPLPIDRNGGDRLYRTGILAGMLVKSGVEVVWWTSTFDHVRKSHRFLTDTTIHLDSGILLKLIYGLGYRRNISLGRLLDHAILAWKFKRQAAKMGRPDIILCSLPSLELPVAATEYGGKHNVPVIVDVRDLWPDIFLEIAPSWFRPIFNLGLAPMWHQANTACKNAYSITGNAPGFVEWGLERANRIATSLDRHFPFGYEAPVLSNDEQDSALQFWANYGLIHKDGVLTVCFFGAFSNQFDLETVIDAALILEVENVDVRFVLCGTGENLGVLKIRAKGSRSIVFPGWVGRAEIWSLMALSDIGIAPYKNHIGFLGNLPNKPIEYMAGGLPVLSGLHGYLEELLETNECGLNYELSDPLALRDAIKGLVANRGQISVMSANAQKLFARHFSAEIVYEGMIAYLKNVVAMHSGK